MTVSLVGWPTKAKEAPSPPWGKSGHAGHQPSISMPQEKYSDGDIFAKTTAPWILQNTKIEKNITNLENFSKYYKYILKITY